MEYERSCCGKKVVASEVKGRCGDADMEKYTNVRLMVGGSEYTPRQLEGIQCDKLYAYRDYEFTIRRSAETSGFVTCTPIEGAEPVAYRWAIILEFAPNVLPHFDDGSTVCGILRIDDDRYFGELRRIQHRRGSVVAVFETFMWDPKSITDSHGYDYTVMGRNELLFAGLKDLEEGLAKTTTRLGSLIEEYKVYKEDLKRMGRRRGLRA